MKDKPFRVLDKNQEKGERNKDVSCVLEEDKSYLAK